MCAGLARQGLSPPAACHGSPRSGPHGHRPPPEALPLSSQQLALLQAWPGQDPNWGMGEMGAGVLGLAGPSRHCKCWEVAREVPPRPGQHLLQSETPQPGPSGHLPEWCHGCGQHGAWGLGPSSLQPHARDAPLTVQHVLDAGLGDDGIVTLEPLVLVLPDEAGVVATLQGPLVVHHSKQRVPGSRQAGWLTPWRHLCALPLSPGAPPGPRLGGCPLWEGRDDSLVVVVEAVSGCLVLPVHPAFLAGTSGAAQHSSEGTPAPPQHLHPRLATSPGASTMVLSRGGVGCSGRVQLRQTVAECSPTPVGSARRTHPTTVNTTWAAMAYVTAC